LRGFVATCQANSPRARGRATGELVRRWFEFGWDGNLAKPVWVATSNTTKRPDQERSEYGPIFVSMPYKATMLEILQGTSLKDFDDFSNFIAQIVSGGSTDAPAADCTAEHVVNGANTYGWRVNQLFTGGIWQQIFGGFPKPGGGFTPPIISLNNEPPSKNG
jgi:hypothetical protein